jgi:MFS family permease
MTGTAIQALRRRSGRGRSRRRARSGQSSHERPLNHEEKLRLALLVLPTFALALATTLVTSYLGKVIQRYTLETIVIGVIIGSEGIMALWIPLIAGSWSDRLRTRIGGRLPFVLAGTIPAAITVLLIGLVGSLAGVALLAAAFFAFYFIAYEPYRALYPDLVSDEVAGRAQSTQAVGRGLGTGVALLAGGLLLTLGRVAPFAFAAAAIVVAIAGFAYLLLRHGLPQRSRAPSQEGQHVVRRLRRMVAEHPALRAYLLANALWEMSLAALKAFVILYMTLGLGFKLADSSLIIGGVALIILIGAALAGRLGDRYGRRRVIGLALWFYGLGYLVPIFTTSKLLIGLAIPFIALGGGAVMTLAYALLIPLMPEHEHGALTGFYSLSRGLGIVTGPILAGALIWVTRHGPFAATHGFQAMWIVCAAGALTSLLCLRAMRQASDDRAELRAA